MTKDNSSFLSQLINEDIYVINKENEPVRMEKEPDENKEEVSETPEATIAEPTEVYAKPLPTSGSNLKHCIVLVESSEELLETELKTLLENILKAVKRSLDDILLVNIKDASEDQLQGLLAEQNHRHLLNFGSTKLNLLKEQPHYQVLKENHKFYLNADDLGQVQSDVAKKKALWSALQEMFL